METRDFARIRALSLQRLIELTDATRPRPEPSGPDSRLRLARPPKTPRERLALLKRIKKKRIKR